MDAIPRDTFTKSKTMKHGWHTHHPTTYYYYIAAIWNIIKQKLPIWEWEGCYAYSLLLGSVRDPMPTPIWEWEGSYAYSLLVGSGRDPMPTPIWEWEGSYAYFWECTYRGKVPLTLEK
jgi:hypothetical protein